MGFNRGDMPPLFNSDIQALQKTAVQNSLFLSLQALRWECCSHAACRCFLNELSLVYSTKKQNFFPVFMQGHPPSTDYFSRLESFSFSAKSCHPRFWNGHMQPYCGAKPKRPRGKEKRQLSWRQNAPCVIRMENNRFTGFRLLQIQLSVFQGRRDLRSCVPKFIFSKKRLSERLRGCDYICHAPPRQLLDMFCSFDMGWSFHEIKGGLPVLEIFLLDSVWGKKGFHNLTSNQSQQPYPQVLFFVQQGSKQKATGFSLVPPLFLSAKKKRFLSKAAAPYPLKRTRLKSLAVISTTFHAW